jgi:protein-S-isoprenylcysteine O-methyltransferase Ste14
VAQKSRNANRITKGRRPMKRTIAFAYGVGSYLACLATFLYAVGFIGNFGVPKSMDSPAAVTWQKALLIDLGLLALFAIQHSVMARRAFKNLVTRVVPVEIERSTYVLASSLALLLLFWKWQPLGGTVWTINNSLGRDITYGGYAFGWLLVLSATFAINHFDLFGLRQVWRHLQGQPQKKLQFATPFFYQIVRHPLYVGWLCVFWITPTMTVTHLCFAATTTAYILVAVRFEERDLMREHPEYSEYRRRVPMLVPNLTRQDTPVSVSGATQV